MTPEQVKLVQETWELVKPLASKAGPMFYDKLFELDPKVKPLFKTPVEEQVNKLFAALNLAVNGLSDVDSIIPVLQQLGVKHIDYGVKAEDYSTVGSALLWTLEQGLGEKFTPEVKEAWATVYTTVASVMTEAAEKAVPAA